MSVLVIHPHTEFIERLCISAYGLFVLVLSLAVHYGRDPKTTDINGKTLKGMSTLQ